MAPAFPFCGFCSESLTLDKCTMSHWISVILEGGWSSDLLVSVGLLALDKVAINYQCGFTGVLFPCRVERQSGMV